MGLLRMWPGARGSQQPNSYPRGPVCSSQPEVSLAAVSVPLAGARAISATAGEGVGTVLAGPAAGMVTVQCVEAIALLVVHVAGGQTRPLRVWVV